MDTYHRPLLKLIEYTTLLMNLNVNDGLQLIIYQHWFNNQQVYPVIIEEIGCRHRWSVLSSEFFCKPKTALKSKAVMKIVCGEMIEFY